MKLTLRQCDWMTNGDWYIIEKYEEPGTHREWEEKSSWGITYKHSARLSDADCEGPACEMLDIAEAISHRRDSRNKRCAVEFRDGQVYFFSPRNTNEDPEPISIADANDLGMLIRTMLLPPALIASQAAEELLITNSLAL